MLFYKIKVINSQYIYLYDVENIKHTPSTIPELLKYNDGTRTSLTNLLCIRN